MPSGSEHFNYSQLADVTERLRMGLFEWLRKTFFGGRRSIEMVPFLDVENKRVIQIPASELRAGAIQVHLQGTDQIVWAIADQLKASDVRHPEFDEGIRDYIRQIQTAFAEHRPLSLEEWEEGFRRDANPNQEIALWLHAADVLVAFTADEPSSDRRRDAYLCIVACLTTGPDDVWKVLRTEVLDRGEAEQVVSRFFGKQA